MKLREIANDIAIKTEMAVASLAERRYHSERSRRKDIVRAIKYEIRDSANLLETDLERAKLYAFEKAIHNGLLDDLSNGDFYEYVTDFCKILKQIGDKNPFAAERETERDNRPHYGETRETERDNRPHYGETRETDNDVKLYKPKRQQQKETHQETDGETKQIVKHAVYEMPERETTYAPIPPRPELPQTPQVPQGRTISSGLTPFRYN